MPRALKPWHCEITGDEGASIEPTSERAWLCLRPPRQLSIRVVMSRSPSAERAPPPRVLLVMPEQWPRALLRAALRELGYDALGARGLSSALRVPPNEADRGPVRVIVIDQAALSRAGDDELARVLARHDSPATILLARPTVTAPDGPWRRVLRRPVSIGDILAAVQSLIPLSNQRSHSLE